MARRFELAPVVLVGLDSRIEASASYDPSTAEVTGHLKGELAPGVTRALPLPARTEGPLKFNLDLMRPLMRPLRWSPCEGSSPSTTVAEPSSFGTLRSRFGVLR